MAELERQCYLVPTNDEEWALLEDVDVGDMGNHMRCLECKQSDFIAYYISHLAGCKTAERIAKSISELPEEKLKERKEMERHL